MILDNPDWPTLTLRALERHHFVQPFDELLELDQHQSLDKHGGLPAQRRSFASALTLGTLPPDYLTSSGKSTKYGLSPGHAWAGRRAILEQSGFYDAMIVGGGDRAIINAMCGEIEGYIQRCILSPAHADHYRQWATGFHRLAQSNISHVPGRLTHLWHGSVQDRNYVGRQAILAKSEFDPGARHRVPHAAGMAMGRCQQAWLHRSVADYFRDRREDG